MHLRTNGSVRYFEACATTHIPQVQLDRVLLCECDHRADELIGLEVDVSGEFITEFEIFFVQEAWKKITSRLFSQSPTRHRLSRTQMGTFKCRATPKCAPQPPHASRPPSRAALPPAPRSLPRRPPVLFCQWRFHVAASLRKASPRRQLNSAKTNTTTLMFSSKVTWL